MTVHIELSVAKVEMVKEVVLQAMRCNPSTDPVILTERLFAAAGRGVAVVDLELPSSAIPPHLMSPQIEPASQVVPEFSAPYPESAMGGETYDPLAVTRELPEFERLPREFGKEHSVIRVGDHTVVMNAAHYADFLAIRDVAERSISEISVMRQAAELSAKTVSDIESLIDVNAVCVLRTAYPADGTVMVSCGEENANAETVRAAVQQCIDKVRQAKAIDDLQKVPLHPAFESLHELSELTVEALPAPEVLPGATNDTTSEIEF
jgi:hypothetical protein